MSASLDLIPTTLERIRQDLVGLKMPRAPGYTVQIVRAETPFPAWSREQDDARPISTAHPNGLARSSKFLKDRKALQTLNLSLQTKNSSARKATESLETWH